ncbi:Csu type fimbrial protein [Solimonas marina]|uniref:Spore coat protein U domain-containing protein n=1 Tax=Solimonas marina TaxID=2714601 RepID=A0A969W7D2_9GAMM|nr:spore coat U domain-containing protein [Solimonas marina]NKF21762.1 spore coat protein U domain-containing protein [Solimonas marina]
MTKLTAAALAVGMSPQAFAVCTVSTTPVAFAPYNPLDSNATNAVGNINLLCVLSIATSYTIKISTGSSGSYASRQLVFAGNTLNYNLYTDSNRTMVWGDGSGGSQTVGGTYLISIIDGKNYSVYARMPARQNVSAGIYADIVNVTVDY